MHTVREIMSPVDCTIPRDTRVSEVEGIMVAKRISGTPLVDKAGKVVGIISKSDIVQFDFTGDNPAAATCTAASLFFFKCEDGAMGKSLYGLGLTIALGMTPAAHADTEEPKFNIVDKVGVVEIRQYEKRLAAEVVVAGEEEDARSAGFRLLADFIFGNNTTRTSIAMTAPVSQQASQSESIAMTAPVAQTRDGTDKWRVRFYMPAKYTLETLPKPNNPAVEIVEVAGQAMAVLRFSNSRSAEAVAEKTADLLRVLSSSKWAPAGSPVTWLYNPPWTLPFFRRNEVAVSVNPR